MPPQHTPQCFQACTLAHAGSFYRRDPESDLRAAMERYDVKCLPTVLQLGGRLDTALEKCKVRIPTGTTRYIPAAPVFALPVWPRPCSCVECSPGSHGGPSARGRVPGDAPLLVFHECTVAHNGTHCQCRRDFPRFCCSCKDGTAVVNVCICVGNFRNLKNKKSRGTY